MPNHIPNNYQPAADLLKDRVILVTGASDGIGRAVAESFAAHGATVILLGRTIKKLEAVYDAIMTAGGPEPAIYPLDLEGANEADYHDLADNIRKEYGRLDGLLHNAGILGVLSPIEHYDVETWQHVMHINVNAAFVMTKACLPLLYESKDASLVFTSSGVGRKGRAYWGAYAASKFATEAMMQILADETESRGMLRVNSINPGATRTKMRLAAYPAEDRSKLPEPKDIVGTYLYLFGVDSKGVSGEAFDCQ
ncbi:MAG TPA: YciK family oxidoreductase [Gammaproteobacteria bacterium]|nr:YciK family oxidoreductase [Gammaproteobacteria bacterium]